MHFHISTNKKKSTNEMEILYTWISFMNHDEMHKLTKINNKSKWNSSFDCTNTYRTTIVPQNGFTSY